MEDKYSWVKKNLIRSLVYTILGLGLVSAVAGSTLNAQRQTEKQDLERKIEDEENQEKTEEKIDYGAIEQIESAGNIKAYNKNSRARGLRQITPIVLKEWNQLHPNEQYKENDLFNAEVNRKIGDWYMDERIPSYLRHFGLEDNVENRLTAYNWGIGKLRKIRDAKENFDKLPKETRDYIRKYERLASSK